MKTVIGFIISGYTWKSAAAAALVVLLCSFVGIRWWNVLVWNLHVVDWLLVLIWVFMTGALAWDVRFAKDLFLFVTASAGGLVIEWWGTNTELWHYFTKEHPPLWIIVAWPVAALTTDRIAFFFERLLPEMKVKWNLLYYVAVSTFIVFMTEFLFPTIKNPASLLVVALMLFVLFAGRKYRRDIVLFSAGSILGIFLEYWGTTRGCWNYYTFERPPLISVFAHGFASVAFARTLDILTTVNRKVGIDLDVTSRVRNQTTNRD